MWKGPLVVVPNLGLVGYVFLIPILRSMSRLGAQNHVPLLLFLN